jgi:hypothetical protein
MTLLASTRRSNGQVMVTGSLGKTSPHPVEAILELAVTCYAVPTMSGSLVLTARLGIL